ncbi:MAG: right-handed parallel beta-helix repeat-containing protein [Bacteroidales bacterium]|nr:right-handed parallel beta-helix repeat-containing protein [Bacteroidales bacterium]
MKKLAILSLAAVLSAMPLHAGDYYASSFGIKSNGTTLNTNAIQKAIDYISSEGGGKLMFKVGRYLTGTIQLKDNVTIDLGEGAVLVGSPNPYDYYSVAGTPGFIVAYQAKNIGITGKGVIDGQGREVANNFLGQIALGFIDDQLSLGRPGGVRPNLIYLRECEGVTLKNVNIRNSAAWTVYIDQCQNTMVDGVTVTSRAFWNNDGVDIVDCRDFTLQNSFIDSADDGICLKSHSASARCDNVLIQNNVVTSSASGIKFGTVGRGGFSNITLLNNTVYDTFRSALAIEAVDGGCAENILVDGLKSLNTANPIFIIVGERWGKGSYARNITIKNMYFKD